MRFNHEFNSLPNFFVFFDESHHTLHANVRVIVLCLVVSSIWVVYTMTTIDGKFELVVGDSVSFHASTASDFVWASRWTVTQSDWRQVLAAHLLLLLLAAMVVICGRCLEPCTHTVLCCLLQSQLSEVGVLFSTCSPSTASVIAKIGFIVGAFLVATSWECSQLILWLHKVARRLLLFVCSVEFKAKGWHWLGAWFGMLQQIFDWVLDFNWSYADLLAVFDWAKARRPVAGIILVLLIKHEDLLLDFLRWAILAAF